MQHVPSLVPPCGVRWLWAATAATRGIPRDPLGLSSPCCSSLCPCQILSHMWDSSASCRNTLPASPPRAQQRPGAPSFSLPSLLLSLTSPSLPEPKFPSQSDSQWQDITTQHASTVQQGDSSTSPNHLPRWLCFEQQLPSCTALPLSQTAPSEAAVPTGARAASPLARQHEAKPG